MPVFGIDISKWQEGFNFDQAVAEGVKFVILRGAFGTYKDKCFEEFYASCKARNIPVGVYLYSIATDVSEARDEANALIKHVLNGKKFEYPIYIDVEDDRQEELGRRRLTDIIIAFCETLENAGYYTGVYSYIEFLQRFTDESRLTKYDKWIARWARKCSYPGEFGMWQFGGETNAIRSNKVAGVTCDQNYAYKDYPTLIKSRGLNGYKRAQAVVTKSVEEVAKEVIKGSWGVGIEREKALTKAGYNYDEVQAKVNELLNKKSVTEIAKEVIVGKWGVGSERKRRLISAGYDYEAVQKKVNELLS
jgi:hypothetical protein